MSQPLTSGEQAIIDLLTQHDSITGPQMVEQLGTTYNSLKVRICKIRQKGYAISGGHRGRTSLGYRLGEQI